MWNPAHAIVQGAEAMAVDAHVWTERVPARNRDWIRDGGPRRAHASESGDVGDRHAVADGSGDVSMEGCGEERGADRCDHARDGGFDAGGWVRAGDVDSAGGEGGTAVVSDQSNY